MPVPGKKSGKDAQSGRSPRTVAARPGAERERGSPETGVIQPVEPAESVPLLSLATALNWPAFLAVVVFLAVLVTLVVFTVQPGGVLGLFNNSSSAPRPSVTVTPSPSLPPVAACEHGVRRACASESGCPGTQVCSFGEWAYCYPNPNLCEPEAKRPCALGACALGYEQCNPCGNGYEPCADPTGACKTGNCSI